MKQARKLDMVSMTHIQMDGFHMHGRLVELAQKEYDKILQVLDSEGDNGIALMDLSMRTRIRRRALQTFLRAHKHFFSLVAGASRYKLNPHPPFNGDITFIRAALQEEEKLFQQQKKMANRWVLFALFMSLVVPISVVVFG